MRTTRLLSTTAAVLLLGAGYATAQDMKKSEQPAQAPAAQQHAPAEKIAPPMTQGARKTPETTGQGASSPESSHSGMSQSPTPNDEKKSEMNGGERTDMKKSEAGKTDTGKSEASQSSKSEASKSDKAETRTTTGQGAAAGSAKLSTTQRTKIATIIHSHKVAPVRLNVSVRVGTRVPDSVHFYPLPREVFAIYPEWRGYDYIMVGDEIVVLDPHTHEIVAVLDA